MSKDGLIIRLLVIENMDPSHIHLAVTIYLLKKSGQNFQQNCKFYFTVVVTFIRTKKELGDRKLKFDWFDFNNQGPKF